MISVNVSSKAKEYEKMSRYPWYVDPNDYR